jgi:pimeloyl-ACP methyl ester carboxylesterase
MAAEPTADPGNDVFVSAQDGLRLHIREFGKRNAPGLPVVCLPGLTRTVRDYDTLAPALANTAFGGQTIFGRRVIAIDSRGRGQSEYDSNPANYSLTVELADVVTVLIARDVGPAVFVGSSRGGILTMKLAVSHPTAIAGVVLNDIGPVIEPTGLARIKSYVGKLPQPRTFEEGAEILRRLFSAQFPRLTAEQWLGDAHRAWQSAGKGGLKPTYDVRIARALADLDIERPQPPVWNEFDALSRVPMLVIRGGNSDLLAAATVEAMRARRAGMQADMQSVEVPDQGHVPLLAGDLVDRIVAFVASCDEAAAARPAINAAAPTLT